MKIFEQTCNFAFPFEDRWYQIYGLPIAEAVVYTNVDMCIQRAAIELEDCAHRANTLCIVGQNWHKIYANYDELIVDLWEILIDIPFDEDILDIDWFIFYKGTPKELIWRWFDEHYSEGVVKLLYG